MKYYAVKKGHSTGVFDSWTACQEATKGFSGAIFQSFASREEAEAFLQDKDLWKERVKKDNADGYLVAFTDGSFDENLARYSYGVILISPDGHESTICGFGNNKRFIESKNIIGEIFGVINAFDWAVSNGYDKIKVYHDYEGLPKWLSGEWTAKTETSKMFVGLFNAKYDGIISPVFEKVPGHSNVSYNDRADQLAKSALVDRKKQAIQGENWYSVPYFDEKDFEALIALIMEADSNISYRSSDLGIKKVYRFTMGAETVTVSLFKTGKQKLLVQGKNTCLFQIIAATIVELDDRASVEQILGNAYRTTIDKRELDSIYSEVEKGLPTAYPAGIKRLIKQALINRKYCIESEDYSQYAFPALKALEGHIKYLLISNGYSGGNRFDCFKKDSFGQYICTASSVNPLKRPAIETCYNYYKANRDTIFHFGNIIGGTDSTRIITNKEDADEIIIECIHLITEQL